MVRRLPVTHGPIIPLPTERGAILEHLRANDHRFALRIAPDLIDTLEGYECRDLFKHPIAHVPQRRGAKAGASDLEDWFLGFPFKIAAIYAVHAGVLGGIPTQGHWQTASIRIPGINRHVSQIVADLNSHPVSTDYFMDRLNQLIAHHILIGQGWAQRRTKNALAARAAQVYGRGFRIKL